MKKSIFITISFFISVALYGQKNIYMGFELGPSFDKYEFFDNGDLLLPVPLASGSFGINFSYPLNKYFSVETGAILKAYTKGYAFSVIGGEVGFKSGGINTVQIPLRLRSRIPLIKDKVFFTSVLGYHHGFNLDKESGSVGVHGSGPDFNFVSHEIYSDLASSFSLLETGVGLEFRVLKTAFLSCSASYFTGFNKVLQSDIVYTLNDGPETRATAYSKGDYSSFNMGIRFPIATIRAKKK